MPLIPPAPSVQAEERIGKLERDLAKLEGIVEHLVSGMATEHQAMREIRQEDRLAMRDLGEKMERSVTGLATEMKRLAERNAAVDSTVMAKQSEALGAISATRWIIGTILTAAALLLAYQAGERHKNIVPDRPSITRTQP